MAYTVMAYVVTAYIVMVHAYVVAYAVGQLQDRDGEAPARPVHAIWLWHM